MKTKLIAPIIILILLSVSVQALMLTPAKTTLDYQPNTHYGIPLTVTNNQEEPINLAVTYEGLLETKINTPEQILQPGEQTTIEVTITTPTELYQDLNQQITITSKPAATGMITTQTSLIHTVTMRAITNRPAPPIEEQTKEQETTLKQEQPEETTTEETTQQKQQKMEILLILLGLTLLTATIIHVIKREKEKRNS